VLTSTRVVRFEDEGDRVTVFDAGGGVHRGAALVGADGVKSAVRAQTVGDAVVSPRPGA
jgi:salicylate hydroxylase